jgi:ABC-type phosphate transport system auxiliary subunit
MATDNHTESLKKLLGVVTALTKEIRHLQGRTIALETFAIEALRSLSSEPQSETQRKATRATLRATKTHLNARLQSVAEKLPPGVDAAALATLNALDQAAGLRP